MRKGPVMVQRFVTMAWYADVRAVAVCIGVLVTVTFMGERYGRV